MGENTGEGGLPPFVFDVEPYPYGDLLQEL